MKRFLGILSIISLLFVACNKVEIIDYEGLIKNTWVCDYVNNTPVYTNDVFVLSFSENGTLLFAKKYATSDSSQQWLEGSNYTYSLKDNIIYIEGTNANNESVSIEIAINSITESSFSFYYQKIVVNGVSETDKSLYTLSNMNQLTVSSIQGVWSGGEISPNTQIYNVYMDLKSDGSYDFYYYDADLESYVLKEDNNGFYFFYKGYIAFNWNTAGEEVDSEIWYISQLTSTNMEWISKDSDGTQTTYAFFRASLPEMAI